MMDTSPAAAALVRDAIGRRAPVDRMRDALAFSEAMREMALTRLRKRFPDRTTLELVELLLGETLIPRR